MRAPAKILVGIFAVAFFLTVASSARADNFNWTYIDTISGSAAGTNVTASGTLTTGAFSGGQATITGINGTVNGTAIASLLPTGSIRSNDNILTYPGTPYLDLSGVSFSLTGGDNVNMYYSGDTYRMSDSTVSISSSYGSLTLTPISAPEPASILLLGLGLVMLFAFARLRHGSAFLRS